MDLSPKMPAKPVSFIFTQNQPDIRLFGIPTTTFMQMIGLTGLSVKDQMIAVNLDAGHKPPVEGRRDLMEQAYRLGKNLL
jgi:hypothetical protein